MPNIQQPLIFSTPRNFKFTQQWNSPSASDSNQQHVSNGVPLRDKASEDVKRFKSFRIEGVIGDSLTTEKLSSERSEGSLAIHDVPEISKELDMKDISKLIILDNEIISFQNRKFMRNTESRIQR